MILGMGDKQIAAAAVGRAQDAAACREMSRAHANHYLRWAEGFFRDVRGDLGFVEGTLLHLWHGDLADRNYIERYRGFGRFAFDPALDLAPEPCGALRWGSRKPDLHRHVSDYFRRRREDGAESAQSRLGIPGE
jgi:hypothetical protein